MTYNQALYLLKEEKIELSEIKDLFSLFDFDFNLIGVNGEKIIDEKKFNKYYKLIKDNYPISYITKSYKTHSLDLYVDKHVLIPRSETIEFIYNYIIKNYDFNLKRILDLGSGSGIISLLIKKEFPLSIVEGVDISSKAVNISKLNAKRNNLEVNYFISNYFKKVKHKYDYIISNPPYVPNSKKTKELKYEPKIALFAKYNGLEEYEKIFKDIDSYLNNKGIVFIELEETNYEKIKNIFLKYNPKYKVDYYIDMNKKVRYLIGKKHE